MDSQRIIKMILLPQSISNICNGIDEISLVIIVKSSNNLLSWNITSGNKNKVTSTQARCFLILKILVHAQDSVLYNYTLLSKFLMQL